MTESVKVLVLLVGSKAISQLCFLGCDEMVTHVDEEGEGESWGPSAPAVRARAMRLAERDLSHLMTKKSMLKTT